MSLKHVGAAMMLAAGLAQALAQTPVTLSEAVESAWRRTARSAEATGQARRAEAQRPAAAALWAAPPALEVGVRHDQQRANGTARETEVGVAVPLWLPGQRGARLAQVGAEVEAAAANAAAARLELAGTVREAAAEVALQRAELAAAEAQSRELDAVAKDVERRVAAGDLARADALQANAERLAAMSALAQADQALQASRLRWQALTGLENVPEPVPAAGTPELSHPALKAAALNLQAARERLNVAKASHQDAPELVVWARQELPSGEPTVNGVGVALRIPFGTAGRNEPLMAAALSEVELAEATERELRQRIDAEVRTAQQAEEAARRQLGDETARARLLRERAGLIEKSFKAGETALVELLRAVTAAAQAGAAVSRSHAALARAASRLEQALGVMP